MRISRGPKLVVEAVVVYQLLGLPRFWEALSPLCDDLRAEGEAVRRKALEGAVTGCGGCGTLRAVVGPFADRLWARLAAAVAVDPAAAGPLVALLADKRGYRPTPVVIYYVAEGRTRTLEL